MSFAPYTDKCNVRSELVYADPPEELEEQLNSVHFTTSHEPEPTCNCSPWWFFLLLMVLLVLSAWNVPECVDYSPSWYYSSSWYYYSSSSWGCQNKSDGSHFHYVDPRGEGLTSVGLLFLLFVTLSGVFCCLLRRRF
jgi:hypothetical protein